MMLVSTMMETKCTEAAIALGRAHAPDQRQFADTFEHRRRYCACTYKSIVAVLEIGTGSARHLCEAQLAQVA
jgi:hypothetical protein